MKPLFNDYAQDVQRQAVGVSGQQGLKQGRPNRNMFGGGPYDPYGKPGGISGAQPGGGPFGPPHNGGINPGGMYGGRPGTATPPDPNAWNGSKNMDPGIAALVGQMQYGSPGNGGINPGGMYGGGLGGPRTVPHGPPGGGFDGDAMPPPTDLPGPRFPRPGNTGPMPPGPWGRVNPRGGNPGGGPGGPPPNPDPWEPGGGGPGNDNPMPVPAGPYGRPGNTGPMPPPPGPHRPPELPTENPIYPTPGGGFGTFGSVMDNFYTPPQVQQPMTGMLSGVSNVTGWPSPQQPILPQESPIFPSRPPQNSGGMGAMNAYLKSF